MLKKTIAVICALSLLISQGIIITPLAADRTAPKISMATPKNNQLGVSIKQSLTIKFSENIYKTSYFSKIKLKRSNIAVPIKTSITKNVLKITHAANLKSGIYYVLTIPAKAVKDKSGNLFIKTYTIKFKTSTAAPVSPTKLTVTEVAKKTTGVVYIELYNKDGNAFASASGVIVDDKIITNCHVIDRASSASIELSDGSWYNVTGIYDYNSYLDIAILKTNAPSLPSLKLGDSSSLVVGEQVVAIGSPLGLKNTVSTGIVSGLRMDEIQISVPISFGSSGGALFNMYGDVVGITSSGYDTIGEINFAIPIDKIKPMMQGTVLKTFDQVRAEIYPSWDEEVEPNDSPLLANNLITGKTVVGILSQKTDEDYYKVSIYTPGDYDFYSTIGGDGWYCENYMMVLKDSSLNTLITASVYLDKDSGASLNQIEKFHLDAGTYYIQIVPNLNDYYESITNMEYFLTYMRDID